MKKFIKSKSILQVAIASFCAVVLVAAIASASTTIGSDITTGGNLTVSGNTVLGDSTADIITMTGIVGATTFNNTVTINGAKGFVMGSSTSALTGIEGMVYYDSTNKVIKMYDGSAWYTVGTTTSGLTLSGARLQLADTNYHTTIGTTTRQGFSILTVEATSTASIPLSIVADTSQTANLLQIMNDASSNLVYVNATGAVFASSTLQATGAARLYSTLTADGNILFDGGTFIFNESSADKDFRVESDNQANMLFVDASADRVGIASSVPYVALGITGTTTASAGMIIGTGGTPLTQVMHGTCSVNPPSTTSATSSLISCAATGVTSIDRVFVTPPSDMISQDNWLVFEGASASTTAGSIEITLFNASTTAAIDSPARTWSWMAIR